MAGGGAALEAGRKGKKALDASLNLVPFIDLLSCCISFLLITAVWTQIAGLQVASSGGPPEAEKKEQTIEVKLLLTEKGYSLSMGGANLEIPKQAAGDAPQFDLRALGEKLKTLKASLPEQSSITVQPEDAVAYDDLINTVDTCLGEQLRNVTVAPLN